MNRQDLTELGRGITLTTVTVYCWCESEIVVVSKRLLAQGITKSCGQPRCKAPVEAK